MDLLLDLDATGERTLQRKIYQALRQRILGGELQGGFQLPATRELARALSSSRTSVAIAYEMLASEGYIESRGTAGTFVSGILPEMSLEAGVSPASMQSEGSEIRLSEFASAVATSASSPSSSLGSSSGSTPTPAPTPTVRSSALGTQVPAFPSDSSSSNSISATPASTSAPTPTPTPTHIASNTIDVSDLRSGLEPDLLNMGSNSPSLSEFPLSEWRRLEARVSRSVKLTRLGYGSSSGCRELKETIADRLRTVRGVRIESPERQILVTTGSKQALDLICRVHLNVGSLAAMEHPGYSGAEFSLLASEIGRAHV